MKKSDYLNKIKREKNPYLAWIKEKEALTGMESASFVCLKMQNQEDEIRKTAEEKGFLLLTGSQGYIDNRLLDLLHDMDKGTKQKYIYQNMDLTGVELKREHEKEIETKLLNADLIYFDEDRIDADGNVESRRDPFFKPDWSPETLNSFFYTGGLLLVSKEGFGRFLRESGREPAELLKNNQESIGRAVVVPENYRLLRDYMLQCHNQVHIPLVLWHAVEEPDYEYLDDYDEPDEKAETKNSFEERVCMNSDAEIKGLHQVIKNKISIVILSKDNTKMLFDLILSLQKYNKTVNYEIVVVDNGSLPENRKLLTQKSVELGFVYDYHPFAFEYSTLCNYGACLTNGEYLLFMNDDILQTEDNDFIQKMYQMAKKPEVGAVGIRLLYPEGRKIQHIGITQLQTGPSHKLAGFDDSLKYDHGRNRGCWNVMAVTGACLMVEKKKFIEIGGFDTSLKIAYTDVDLCLDLLEKGYRNVVINEVSLLHYESVSRGDDRKNKEKTKRLNHERNVFYEFHPWLLENGDPYYNRNLTKNRLEYCVNYVQEWEKEEMSSRWSGRISSKCRKERLMSQIDRSAWVASQNTDTDGYYEIEGWVFLSGRNQLWYDKCLVLKDLTTGEEEVFCVQDKYREDLKQVFPSEKYLLMSGFVCKIAQESLVKNRTYEIIPGVINRFTGKCYIKETSCQIKNATN